MESEAPPDREFADTVHRILANRHRRRILQYLDGEVSATVDELVDRLAEEGPEPASPDDRRIEIELDHNHLPLMADTGTIEYDDGTGRVALTSRGRTAAEVRRLAARRLEERTSNHV